MRLGIATGILYVFMAGLDGRVLAQERPTGPVFSLEAVAVEGSLLPEPTPSVRVGPGERILAKVFLRDWSVNGQKLRGYQAELNPEKFTGDGTGSIKPTGYDDKRARQEQNSAAAYIDDKDPQYVCSGLHILPIVDTLNAPGYRWLTVLLDAENGPIAAQDGKKFYLGTLELEVSTDASGTFRLGFIEDIQSTGLLDYDSVYIEGNQYEYLTIEVDPKLVRLMIRESDPPDGAVDARLAGKRAQGSAQPWSEVSIRFSLDASAVSADDFEVTDGTNAPPSVQALTVDGMNAQVRLSSAIKPGRWTDVTYQPTGARVRMGFLPGDVNNDGRAVAADVSAMVQSLNGNRSLPAYQTDLDRDGKTSPEDLMALIDLISGLQGRGGERIAAR